MDELISRQVAIDIAKELIITINGYEQHNQAVNNYSAKIMQLPSAQPERRKEILYRHYKGGTYELVCNNVTHTETGESLVIYRDYRGQLWARPESMFYGLVKVGDVLEPRFVLCRSEGDVE